MTLDKVTEMKVERRKASRTAFNKNLKKINLHTESWEIVATDRSSWQASIHKGAAPFETYRICEAKQKCQQIKDRLLHLPDADCSYTHMCSMCHHTFWAQIGLISHRRVHNKWQVAVIIATDGQEYMRLNAMNLQSWYLPATNSHHMFINNPLWTFSHKDDRKKSVPVYEINPADFNNLTGCITYCSRG